VATGVRVIVVGDGAGLAGVVGAGVGVVADGAGAGDADGELEADLVGAGSGELAMVAGSGGTGLGVADGDRREELGAFLAAVVRWPCEAAGAGGLAGGSGESPGGRRAAPVT
jgi:hypothetical protein